MLPVVFNIHHGTENLCDDSTLTAPITANLHCGTWFTLREHIRLWPRSPNRRGPPPRRHRLTDEAVVKMGSMEIWNGRFHTTSGFSRDQFSIVIFFFFYCRLAFVHLSPHDKLHIARADTVLTWLRGILVSMGQIQKIKR